MKLLLFLYRGLYIVFLWQYWYFPPAGRGIFRVIVYFGLVHMLISQVYQWIQAELSAQGKKSVILKNQVLSDLLNVGIRVKNLSEARRALAFMIALCIATVFLMYVPLPRYLGQM